MMAVEAGFTNWLNDKLRELNTDETVFGSYITGILETEENVEDKTEALEGILSEILEDNLSAVINEIIQKWNECHPKVEKKKSSVGDDVDTQLAKILETQKLQATVQKQYTEEELRIRKKILAQYSQLSLSEESGEDTDMKDEGESSLVKNTNAHDVQQALKERRELAKLESQKKKEKDKEDREKQKQLKEEKKEKRKTVKGERRR